MCYAGVTNVQQNTLNVTYLRILQDHKLLSMFVIDFFISYFYVIVFLSLFWIRLQTSLMERYLSEEVVVV